MTQCYCKDIVRFPRRLSDGVYDRNKIGKYQNIKRSFFYVCVSSLVLITIPVSYEAEGNI